MKRAFGIVVCIDARDHAQIGAQKLNFSADLRRLTRRDRLPRLTLTPVRLRKLERYAHGGSSTAKPARWALRFHQQICNPTASLATFLKSQTVQTATEFFLVQLASAPD